ncbi:GGDEF domain-containing protein [Sphingomonas japonica]|uniref:diguanylate cyclase n=1 Tax=Sphingomonas japonica TaxID=511662 RepID=A0ABX0U1S5_9SPHN|nr:diguanylate cyclase [Sphingomonas japonica]NIJ23659.1 diguanylate cyclase [Sphingomonas japonica]
MMALFQQARAALDFLELHKLEPSADNYAFALDYVMNPGSEMAHEVNEKTYGGLRLASGAVHSLIERFLSERRGNVLDHRERTVARQAEELGTLTSDAHDLTEALGRDVGAIVQQPGAEIDRTKDLVARLSDAERDLAELRDELRMLRTAVGAPGQSTDVDRDELTQALNQRGAQRVFDALAEHGRPYVLMMFSLDDLAGINKRFGHDVGGNVINAFAATLRQVFAKEELIRWTGNEFIIVAADLATAAARLLVEDALTALSARRLKLRGNGAWIGTVTASAGVVVSQNETPTTALVRARANMLAAAAQGGNHAIG